jgi:hypothetical protein
MIGSAGPKLDSASLPSQVLRKGGIPVSGADGPANWTLKAAARRGHQLLVRA